MKVSDLKNKELVQACKEFQVKKLYAFGSAVSGEVSPESDLDFLVDFERTGYAGSFDQFMGFKQRLEEIYQRPVDLLTVRKFRNPLFQQEVVKAQIIWQKT